MGTEKHYTRDELLLMADKLVSARITFGELDKNGEYLKEGNKGDLGMLVEDCWFGQKPHNDSEPDFRDAHIELKVSPYYNTNNGVSAKERLVCNIINYRNESLPGKVFRDSSFWKKCENILLLSYHHAKGEATNKGAVFKKDLFVDKFALIEGYPEEDLLIIMEDWNIIVSKIRAGKAHELSESDTKYLGACTKGSTAQESFVEQPYSRTPAKQRAFALKTTYMTRLLRKYVFGDEESPHIITDVSELKKQPFDDIILERILRFRGRTENELLDMAGITSRSKQVYARLTNFMMGLGNTDKICEEFLSANIKVRSIHVEANGNIKESVSFPTFCFEDLLNQEWESSDLYNDVISARFLFVIYRISPSGITRLAGAGFWNMSYRDAEEAHRVWNRTIEEIKNNAGLRKTMRGGQVQITNTLPKISESPIMHVRPHTSRAAYLLKDGTEIGNIFSHADRLPNGEWMTKQCFWLNASYVEKIVKGIMKKFDDGR